MPRKSGSGRAFTQEEADAVREYWRMMQTKYGISGVPLGHLLHKNDKGSEPNLTQIARARDVSVRAVSEIVRGLSYRRPNGTVVSR